MKVFVVREGSHEYYPCAIFADIGKADQYARWLVEEGHTDVSTITIFDVLEGVPTIKYDGQVATEIVYQSEERRRYGEERVKRMLASAESSRKYPYREK